MDATPRLLAALLCAAGAALAAPALAGATGGVRLIVGFRPGTGTAAQAAAIAHAGAVRMPTPTGLRAAAVVTVPAGREARALGRLDRAAAVAYAEPAHVLTLDRTPTDPDFQAAAAWAYERPGFPAAWNLTTGSSTVTVAVVDTGVDPVPDLAGALVPGHDFLAGTGDPIDDNGHGTEVAGTIAARGDNGIGVAGACWSCRIMPLKVADAAGRAYDYDVAAGIDYAVDHGAQIVNVSLEQGSSTQVLADAVSYAQAHGVLVVAAAGNEGSSQVGYPAGYSGVLSVAASDPADGRYAWSSYGNRAAVAAPGCVATTSVWGGYGVECGTSFAAPLTAGLAALLLSAKPDATASQVAAAIEQSALPVQGGWVARGRIDAPGALAALGVTEPQPPVGTAPSATGEGQASAAATGTGAAAAVRPRPAGRIPAAVRVAARFPAQKPR